MAFDEIEPFDEGRSNQSVILLDQIKLDAFISSVSYGVFFKTLETCLLKIVLIFSTCLKCPCTP